MRIDLHTHAHPSSSDATHDVFVLARSLREMGADGAALTDHGPGRDYEQARRAFEAEGLLFVPGRELQTPIGHVLALTTDTDWLRSAMERQVLPLDVAPDAPVALVWAHPAGWRVAGSMIAPDPSRGAEHVHAVEVLNGERLWQRDGVSIAADLARDLRAGMTGGSDAHRPGSAGRCFTIVDEAFDAAGVIDAIRDGRSRPVLGAEWADHHGLHYQRDDLAAFVE